MIFGRKRDTVPTPAGDAAELPRHDRDTVKLVEDIGPTPREVVRAIAALNDDMKWLAERFEKLQARVTTELREIRREVDRFYDEPEES